MKNAIEHKISANTIKSDRLAFDRKRKRLDQLIEQLSPYQQQQADILIQMQPIIDEINEVRAQMVAECVHPKDFIVDSGDGFAACKFCNKTLRLVNETET